MIELAAWVAFPLAALNLSCGLGLVVERVAGLELHPALLAPFGFCAGIVLVGPVYAAHQGAELALAVLLAGAAAGYWLGRRELRARLRPGLGAAAGVAAYALYMLPVLATGKATFLGYNLLNDTAIHLALVDYLDDWGRRSPDFLQPGTFHAAMQGYVGQSYPLGSHELLAAWREAVPIDAAHLYQPFLAICAAFAAAALFAMLREAGAPRMAAAGGAALALASQLLFSFNLQGGIKEISFVTALAALAGAGAAFLRSGPRARAGIAVGVCGLAAYAIYGLSALAWLGPAALLLAIAALVSGPRENVLGLVKATAAALIVFAVLGLPTVLSSVDFYDKGRKVLESQQELGPLGGPIHNSQVSGIWLNGDYRFAPRDRSVDRVVIAMALLLAAAGLLLAIRRRLWGPLLFVVPPAVAWLVVSGRSSPYIDAKLLAVLSPAMLLFSALGLAAIWSSRLRLLAVPLAAVLLAAAVYGDAAAYRLALTAPIDRLEELSDVGDRYEGQGLVLLNEFEEYAKHFGRHSEMNPPYEVWTAAPAVLRTPGPTFGLAYTLDDLDFGYIRRFGVIVLRRSPAEARPPDGYELDFRGHWYEAWVKQEEPPVAQHVPLDKRAPVPWSATAVPDCSEVRKLGRANALVAPERPAPVLFDIANEGLPFSWRPDGVDQFGVIASGPGTLHANTSTPAGTYTVWLRGRSFRDDEISVDGRRVGVAHEINGPQTWTLVGHVTLASGGHTVTLHRPGRALGPGGKQSDSIGPVVLVADRATRLVRTDPGKGAELCGRELDWIEQLSG